MNWRFWRQPPPPTGAKKFISIYGNVFYATYDGPVYTYDEKTATYIDVSPGK